MFSRFIRSFTLIMIVLAPFKAWTTGKAETIVIQASKFPQHFKLAIKWKEKIPYQVEQNGQETVIVFDRDAKFQEVGASALPPYIDALETKNIEGSLVTKLKISQSAELKHSWEEGSFIIDILNSPSKKSHDFKLKDPSVKQEKNPVKKKSEPLLLKASVTGRIKDEKPELIFEWDKPVKMAALHWGENLILAFDQPALFDLSLAYASEAKIFRKLSQLDIKDKSILVLPLSQTYKPRLTQDKTRWILELSQGAPDINTQDLKAVYSPLPQEKSKEKTKEKPEEKIIFDAEGLGSEISFEDPQTGFQLTLFPSENLIPTPRKYLQFDILPSLQGVAILRKEQALLIANNEKGFEVRASKPFLVSKAVDLRSERKIGQPEPLIKFDDFKIDANFNFREEVRARENDIAYKKGKEREKALFVLTHLFLLEGLAKEALSQINIAILENPKLLNNPQARALRALAALLDQDEETLTLDIHSTPLNNEPDAEFLKALYRVSINTHNEDSYKLLLDNIYLFNAYPSKLRNQLAFIAAEAAARCMEDTQPFIDLINQQELNPLDQERYDFYRASSFDVNKKFEEARDYYKKLEKAKNTEVRVRSRLAMIEMQLKENRPFNIEFIKTLEELRFMWTGDNTELRIFELLGDLYAKEKNYMKALTILREAYRGLAYLPKSKDLQPKIVKLFEENILKNEQNSPMDLVVFYKEFGSFMPEGEIKALILLKLIEAYISLDLLENAEKMLESLLKDVASEDIKNSSLFLLADIYVRDHKYRKALDLIKPLESKDLPDKLVEKRYLLTFKSLLGLSLYDQAAELIDAHEQTHDTNLQRLELAWNRKDWKIAQNILSALVYDKDEEGKLDPLLILNYAISAFFNEDKIELKHLRENFIDEMKKSEHSEAFDIITSEEPAFEPTQVSLAAKLSDLKTFEDFVTRLQGKKTSSPSKA